MKKLLAALILMVTVTALYGQTSAEAHFNRGNEFLDKKDWDNAIRLNPNDANAYFRRGHAYYNNLDYYRAIADFEAVLRIDPFHSAANEALGFLIPAEYCARLGVSIPHSGVSYFY